MFTIVKILLNTLDVTREYGKFQIILKAQVIELGDKQ